jgi:AbrB family looped-hinge helix DNA binding protein
MLIELRKKSQITLPKEIVNKLNLEEGDKFEVSIENGIIKLEPVAVYKVQYIAKLVEEVQILREEVNCKYHASNSVDDLMKKLKDKE